MRIALKQKIKCLYPQPTDFLALAVDHDQALKIHLLDKFIGHYWMPQIAGPDFQVPPDVLSLLVTTFDPKLFQHLNQATNLGLSVKREPKISTM